MSDELKPCPFCGTDAELIDQSTGSWRVICRQSKGGCGATSRMAFDKGATAIAEWNRRAQQPAQAASIDTPEFREIVEFWSGKYHSALAPIRQGQKEAWAALIAYIDARRAAVSTTGDAPADPMDWPIPCDVKVGAGTIKKGCKLRTLVVRMESLHRMAMEGLPKVTPEQRAQFEALIAALQSPTEEA